MRWARLVWTTSFRLTVGHAGLFSASACLLFAITYWSTAGYMADQLEDGVDDEIGRLLEETDQGGPARLAAVIDHRLAGARADALWYLLQAGDGRRLAGNLPPRPVVTGWLDLPSPTDVEEPGEEPHRVRARGMRLESGGYLLVGDDADQLDEVKELIVRAFAWGAAVTLLLALGAGTLLSAGLLRRVETFSQTARAIMRGDLSRRIESRGRDDEFDHLAASLNAMLDRIQALMDGLRQVSNDIAHDLRTPLSRLRQRLEAARRKAISADELAVAIDRSLHDVDAILDTFAALLRIARVEAAPRAGFATVDLSELLETVVEVYASTAEDRHQAIMCAIAQGLIVQGDRELLTQMLANLVDNAIRHSPDRTIISVAAAMSPDGIAVTIADAGPGIPDAERGRVFRRFYRLESSRTTPGSGLGLSLVAAVAGLHGLKVELSDARPGLKVRLAGFEPGAPTPPEVTAAPAGPAAAPAPRS